MAETGLAELDAWLTSANDVFEIDLLRPNSQSKPTSALEEPFNPTFTYPIFGEEETIFGHKGLRIKLSLRAHDLRPSLEIRQDEVFKPIGKTQAMDVKEMMKDFLPSSAFENTASKERIDTIGWKPPGTLLTTYKRGGRSFEIWYSSLSKPEAKEILRGMQILVPLFIEGGTLQDLEEAAWTIERWKLFLIYEVTPLKSSPKSTPYTFVGFSTSYRLWVPPTVEISERLSFVSSTPVPLPTLGPNPSDVEHDKLPPYNPLESPSRERISQFLILPPFQGQSHGAALYTAMASLFRSDASVFEITVEDPNEAFDDLRDWSDLAYLRSTFPSFKTLQVPDSVPAEMLAPKEFIPVNYLLPPDVADPIRYKSKIAPRQFARLCEMHLLSGIPPLHRSKARITRKDKSAHENDRRYFFWRLLVKERLYIRNKDQLVQLDREERIEKVEQTVDSVEEEYVRLLNAAEKRGHRGTMGEEEAANGKALASRGKRKTRVVEEDEDEDEDDTDHSKRIKRA
ncbi:acyl-CoA N-acyltransferase [Patellaria atrata CBS 101060]|uniref:Histone acetyltransferase type B catalytic subunit n=1 Tax=Patellaria atrata CBS 101060 TaxID=1346257 RepID=A0A9P4VNZ5_9PEZI|nr:acyl-CoA N-acyltransferase [Patellaria atrata CBS 101060]